RSARELRERGLWVTLNAYGRNVFLDFQEAYDGAEGLWGRINERLPGRGERLRRGGFRFYKVAISRSRITPSQLQSRLSMRRYPAVTGLLTTPSADEFKPPATACG